MDCPRKEFFRNFLTHFPTNLVFSFPEKSKKTANSCMKAFYFFDQLDHHFCQKFPFSDLARYLSSSPVPEFSIARGVLYTNYLHKLLHILKIPNVAGSANKELRPIFQLVSKIDPYYFTETSISEEILKCYTLTSEHQAQLLKCLMAFFKAFRHSSSFNRQTIANEGWEKWYEIFPEGNSWQVLQMFSDLGERVVASWQGYRAWYRFHYGTLPAHQDGPFAWQEICGAWATAKKKEAVYPDLLSHGFAGELAHLEVVGYCGDTPDCTHCPLQESCRWQQSLPDASKSEEIQTLIQKQQLQNLKTAELMAWIFDLEEDHATALHALLSGKNSLRSLDQKTVFELTQHLPDCAYFGEKLKAFLELCKRYNEEKLIPGDAFSCSADIFQHFRFRLRDLKQECFILVLLDNKHQYLADIVVTKGILNKSLVHPREVFGAAIENRAAAIICVHNHPSGDPKASPEDIQITRRLSEVGKVVGIPLLDHVIIGNDRYVSLADQGLL